MTKEAAGATYRSGPGQRLMVQASGNVQLLAVLAVLRAPSFEDAEYLMDAAVETRELAGLAADVERMHALDADGSTRERLRTCIERAVSTKRAVASKAVGDPDLAEVAAKIVIGLDRLLIASEQLHTAIERHDRPFEARKAPKAAQA